jgi:tRNA1(Val) A37 N6-methylase TrmN6
MTDLASLVNRKIDFAYRGARLVFELSHGLFSSFDVDAGTRLLLKEIARDEKITTSSKILDAGCGTGIIGISLAASCPDSEIVMRDRDLLAVAFSGRNCWLNGITASIKDVDGAEIPETERKFPKKCLSPPRNAKVTIAPGLLDASDDSGPYDAVVSNLPAKAGQNVLSEFFRACANDLLKPGGRAAFVIVNTLADLAKKWCKEAGLEIVRSTASKSHTVLVLEKRFREPNQNENTKPMWRTENGLPEQYTRTKKKRALGLHEINAFGFWGLGEFDTDSYATDLVIESAAKICRGTLVRELLVHEPGIGLSALWAESVLGPETINIVSRDILALYATRKNITLNFPTVRYRSYSSLDLAKIDDASVDLAIWMPDEIPGYDFISPAWDTLVRTVKKSASIIVASNSTVIARFETAKPEGVKILDIRRHKGTAVLEAMRIA